jgi:inner membrane protein
MPSPIAHASVGYLIYRSINPKNHTNPQNKDYLSPLLWTAILFSLIPDFDFIPGFLFGTYDQFHNTFSNSFFSGLIFAIVTGVIGWSLKKSFLFWFTFPLISYELHVIMDFFTWGRGLMLFWPFDSSRYEPEIYFFYGLHRSDGLVSLRHLWTILTELSFSIILVFIPKLLLKFSVRGRSLRNR